MIDPFTVQRIFDAAQILDVVSDYVPLKKAGINYKGVCPFHSDRDPSLVVSPAKGLYKCFACGNGGNAVKFIMNYQSVSYVEALRILAKKYNIDIHERELTDDEKEKLEKRDALFIINEWACQFFQDYIEKDPHGRDIGLSYFRSRGFRDDIIKKYRLGMSPQDKYAIAKASEAQGFNLDYVVETGLCYRKENDGTIHDRFYDRAMFPIFTKTGKVVGFGGRVLAKATKGVDRKYVNSPESDIYDKSSEVYGLYQAKGAIQKEDKAIVVEGYTDVISMAQCGIENVVAASGTALTENQIKLIGQYTKNITLLFDGDAAGVKATNKSIALILKSGMNVKILSLPDPEDPDSFSRSHTAEEFKSYIKTNEVDFIKYKTQDYSEADYEDPAAKRALIDSLIEYISAIPNELTRKIYTQQAAKDINIPESFLQPEINKAIDNRRELERKANSRQNMPVPPENSPMPLPTEFGQNNNGPQPLEDTSCHEKNNRILSLERKLVQQIIRNGQKIQYSYEDETGKINNLSVAEFIRIDQEQDNLEFHNSIHRQILKEACEQINKDPDTDLQRFFNTHYSKEIMMYAVELMQDQYIVSSMFKNNDIHDENSYIQVVNELSLNWKYEVAKQNYNEILSQIKKKEEEKDIMGQLELTDQAKGLKEIRDILAKKLGDRIYH